MLGNIKKMREDLEKSIYPSGMVYLQKMLCYKPFHSLISGCMNIMLHFCIHINNNSTRAHSLLYIRNRILRDTEEVRGSVH